MLERTPTYHSKVRSPTTIKTALMAGFLVILAVWLASTSYFTARLASTQERSAAIHVRYARGQELLFTVRSQVLLGSIYLRDALIEIDQAPAQAASAREQLRGLQAQVTRELQQYTALDPGEHGEAWARLATELRDYWDIAVRLIAPAPDDGRTAAHTRLHTEVIPRRDGIIRLSDDLRQVMADNVRREQQELNDANQQMRRRIRDTTIVAVSIGVVIAILSTWYVGRLETLIREEHAEVARNRQELRDLSERLVRAQEDERRTIARELHDEIGQALTAVDVELAVAATAAGSEPRAAAAIDEARTVAQRALAGVRDLSQLLRPSMLDDFGLPEALKWYLRKFSDRTGVRTELVQEGPGDRLPIDVEVCVYRAIQEALTNVSRHAHATACRVSIRRLASSLVVSVEDDGIGWQRPASGTIGRRGGLGLIGIRERVSGLGGTFRIEGTSGHGTRLWIELPVTTRS